MSTPDVIRHEAITVGDKDVAVQLTVHWDNIIAWLGQSAATNKNGHAQVSRDNKPLITAKRAENPLFNKDTP